MLRIILAIALFICAGTASAQLMQPLLFGGFGAKVISITACGSNACSYTPGTTNTIGQAVAILSNGSKYSGTWSMPTSGVDHTGAACPNNAADFTISSTGLLASTAASTNQTSACIATLGRTPYVQLVSLTGASSMACGPSGNNPAGSLTTFTGSVPTPASNAGFTTCALNFDWSNPFYGTNSNWLDCTNSNTNLIWHKNYFGANTNGPCSDIAQTTDGSNTVLAIPWFTSYDPSAAGGMVTACPCTGFTISTNFYIEGIWRVTAISSDPSNGGSSQFWLWQVPTNEWEVDAGELWGHDFGFVDQTLHDQAAGGGGVTGYTTCGGCNPPNGPSGYTVTAYHKYGVLFTSDGSTNQAVCYYVDDILQVCNTVTQGGLKYTERLFILGTISSADTNNATNWTLMTKYVRVFSCASWQSTACNGTSEFNDGTTIYWH